MARWIPAAVAAASALLVPAAQAADPGLWTETGRSTIPLYYFQGIAHDSANRLFFAGIHVGLYRTDAQLREQARRDDVVPPAVHLAEGYNHIGDIDWDAREGGRVLLPMECYYPRTAPGEADPDNPCKTGSIAVADPDTLEWRYYVKLDPAEIPKAMWVAVSPDGTLAWTGSGRDLLAYSMDDISPARAAPSAAPIKAVRRIPDAQPPSGITGAAFLNGRLYVAGDDSPEGFQVWSIDLNDGARRLEIERTIVGESEGLDVGGFLGGSLHWMIAPYNTAGLPTYGTSNSAILHFVSAGGAAPGAGPPARPSRIRVKIRPRRVRARGRARLRFKATAMVAGRMAPVDRARVRFAGRSVLTNSRGQARLIVRLRRRGKRRAWVGQPGFTPGRGVVRVLRPRR